MKAQELLDEADRLFPNTNICLNAKVWNRGRSFLELWVESSSRHFTGESLEEIAAAIRVAACKAPDDQVSQMADEIAFAKA